MTEKTHKLNNFLLDVCNKDIINFIESKDYNENNKLLVSLLYDSLDEKQEEKINNITSDLSHNKDHRESKEYLSELIRGWIMEDVLKDLISEKYDVTLAGSDNERKILKDNKNITTEADLKIYNKSVEVITDFNSYWDYQDYIDLRDNKYNKIKNNNSLVLAVDIENNKIFIFDTDSVINSEKYYNENWSKECHKLEIEDKNKYNINNINKAITDLL